MKHVTWFIGFSLVLAGCRPQTSQSTSEVVNSLPFRQAILTAKQASFPFQAKLELAPAATNSGSVIFAFANDFSLDQQTFIELSSDAQSSLDTPNDYTVWLGTPDQPRQLQLGPLQTGESGVLLQYSAQADWQPLKLVSLYNQQNTLVGQAEFLDRKLD